MNRALLDDILFACKHPRHQGTLAVEPLCDANISCGDEIKLYISVKEGKITDAKYTGKFCSIANYGAELLISHIVGLSVSQSKTISSQKLLAGRRADSLLQNPTRLKCFELAQRALGKYI